MVGLTTIELLVLPVLQVKDVAPVTDRVSVTEFPWVMVAEGLAVIVSEGTAFTVTVAVAVLLQPLPSTPVTEYVPAVVALNVLPVVLLLQV